MPVLLLKRSECHTDSSRGNAKFPFGRIDACTTANIGIIGGGTATNVVPDTVELEGEIRTDYLDQGEQMMQAVIADFEAAATRLNGTWSVPGTGISNLTVFLLIICLINVWKHYAAIFLWKWKV